MQIFTLGGDIEPKIVEGMLLKTRKHEVVNGAYTYDFQSENGNMFLTGLGGKLQEVTYDCRGFLPWTKKTKIKKLLAEYGVDQSWVEVFNDRSGSLFQSPDEVYYATWSYKTALISFGVMCFREELHRIVT